MNDAYVELLVKCKENTGALVLKSISYALGILFLLFSVLTGFWLTLLFAVLCGLFGYWLSSFVKIEYEYLFLDKTLSIDRISNQMKRKTVAEYDLSHAEIVAPVASGRLDVYKNNPQVKVVDFSSRLVETKPFAIFIRKGDTWEKIVIEMNEALFSQMEKKLPRIVFKD